MNNAEKFKEIFKEFATEVWAFPEKDFLTWLNAEYEKGTTKNNLEVDCIDRAEVLKLMQDNWHTHNGDWAMQESMDDIRALPSVTPQEPKFIAKADGTIEQIKNCDDCLFKKEWEKIGKLLSVVLEKKTEQEPKEGHWIMHEKHRECSECGVYLLKDMPRNSYCPNCGADMRGGRA